MTTKAVWWQTTKTARQGFWLGGIWMVIGLGDLLWGTISAVIWSLIPGAVFLVGGVAHLASAVALRRRQRASVGPVAQPTASHSALLPSS
jgi:uncharacterized membrane protein HdeD (DUF308 family)